MFDGISDCCCYGMTERLGVTVHFFNDGLLDVCVFMMRVEIETRLVFDKLGE